MDTTTDTITTTDPDTTDTDPAQVVGAVYAAFGRGDMAALLAGIHPEVDWSVDVTAPGGDRVPMFRRGVGHDAVGHYFAGVGEMEFHTFDVRRLVPDGDVVIAEVAFEATHRTTGKRAAIEELHHWVVRDGLVVRYQPYVDTAAVIDLYTA